MIHYHIFIHKNITFNEDIVYIFTQNVGNIKIIVPRDSYYFLEQSR